MTSVYTSTTDRSDKKRKTSSETKKLHRKRAHVTGQWTGHLRCTLDALDHDICQEMASKLQNLLNNAHDGNGNESRRDVVVTPHETHHVSLSRVFTVHHNSIASLTARLQAALQQVPPVTVRISYGRPRLLTSHDHDHRVFLVLPVEPARAVQPVMHAIDAVLQQYGLPTYYDPPVYHVSVAEYSCGDDNDSETTMIVPDQNTLSSVLGPDNGALTVCALDHVVCALGGSGAQEIRIELGVACSGPAI